MGGDKKDRPRNGDEELLYHGLLRPARIRLMFGAMLPSQAGYGEGSGKPMDKPGVRSVGGASFYKPRHSDGPIIVS